MCGSGRFLVPLLAEGVDVEGVDASAEMLAGCRRRAEAAGVRPVLRQGLSDEPPRSTDDTMLSVRARRAGA